MNDSPDGWIALASDTNVMDRMSCTNSNGASLAAATPSSPGLVSVKNTSPPNTPGWPQLWDTSSTSALKKIIKIMNISISAEQDNTLYTHRRSSRLSDNT